MAFGAISSAKDVCLVTVETLENIAGANDPKQLNPYTYGTTQAILDGMRTAGAMRIDTRGNKGIPSSGVNSENRLRIKYQLRRCNDSQSVDLDPCSQDDEDGIIPWAYGDLTFGDPIIHKFEIDMADMRQVCEGYEDQYRWLLREAYDSLKRQANARYITQLGANTGKYFAEDCNDAVAVTDYQAPVAFYDTSGQPKPMGVFKVDQQYRRFGFNGRPRIIGGNPIDALGYSNPLYAGNTAGLDAQRLGMNLYRDYQLNTVLGNGNENILSIPDGAAHIVNWRMFDLPDFRRSSDTTVRTTLDLGQFFGEPAGQFVVDWTMHIKECGAGDVVIIHKFFLYTELFMLTSDMLVASCGQCSNGILLWNHDCADPSCDDIDPVIVDPNPA